MTSSSPFTGARRPAVGLRRLGAVVGLVAGTSLAVTGCADGLQFVRDERVRFVSPDSGDEVTAPVTFEWESSIPEGQTYALVLREVTIRPGAPVTDLVPKDGACRVTGDCLEPEALERANIYLTTGTSLTVDLLPALSRDQTLLRVSLILVDNEGRRDGESLWYVNIRLPDPT